MTIEKNINKLESLLDAIETSDIDLNGAMDSYAESLKLAEATFKDLEKTEQKLMVLNQKRDTLFDLEDNE
ncbi:MAG: exodeoxyribonuclease VII small subunit [bacterium]|nr:exodeoxyribonuclease VII small subunit [bacterium]